jgi:hypothetical protein
MTFSWSTFATLAVLAAALHWLIARAQITKRFWDARWLPGMLSDLLECPACSGFWIGLGFGTLGVRPLITGHTWLDIVAAGVSAMYGTPLAEAVLIWGLDKSKIH